ncbi:MAG: terminase large subunit domain-containing protein [Bacteroidota bacterium]
MQHPTLKYHRPKMTAYQTAFMDTSARYSIIEAATKTGKTTACMIWLFERALLAGELNGTHGLVWWVAPVIRQAEIAFYRLQQLCSGQKIIRKVRKTKLTIELMNGAIIECRSAEKPDNLYGEDVHAIVIDEASRCKAEAWHAARSTLTATQGPAKIIGNVKGRGNWMHKLAMLAEDDTSGRYARFKITAWDAVEAGILSAAEIEDARQTLPEHVFRELYLAEPADDGTNPFGLQAIADAVQLDLSAQPARFFGIDLAKSSDWTVIIGLDVNGQIAHYERFQRDWQATHQAVRRAVGLHYALADSTGVGDAIVERLARELPMLGGFKFTSQSKQQLMEALAVGLQEGQVGVLEGRVREELEVFETSYSPSGNVRYEAPTGFHDDCVCALALANKCRLQNKYSLQYQFIVE